MTSEIMSGLEYIYTRKSGLQGTGRKVKGEISWCRLRLRGRAHFTQRKPTLDESGHSLGIRQAPDLF
jgi:hypothetical protein